MGATGKLKKWFIDSPENPFIIVFLCDMMKPGISCITIRFEGHNRIQ
jgi:hypothetical protein